MALRKKSHKKKKKRGRGSRKSNLWSGILAQFFFFFSLQERNGPAKLRRIVVFSRKFSLVKLEMCRISSQSSQKVRGRRQNVPAHKGTKRLRQEHPPRPRGAPHGTPGSGCSVNTGLSSRPCPALLQTCTLHRPLRATHRFLCQAGQTAGHTVFAAALETSRCFSQVVENRKDTANP